MTDGLSPAAGVPVGRKGLLLRLAVAALALCPFLMSASVAHADHSSLQLVSGGAAGSSGSYTDFYAVSQDNAIVVFGTTDQLVPADTDNSLDVYQRSGSTTTLVSTGPNGGNGDFPASFGGASQDGSRIFFQTQEQLVATDTDNSLDVYERSGGTTTLISTGPTGGNGAHDAYFVGSSLDGSRRFFQTSEQLTGADSDNQQDVYMRSGAATTTLISTGPAGGNGNFPADFGGSSADGTRVFFETNEQMTSGDTDSSQDVYERSSGSTTLLSTGSTGGNGALNATFEGSSTDGTRVFFTTDEALVSGDTDPQQQDVYERSGSTTTVLSTGSTGNGNARAVFVGSSADGSHVFFETQEKLVAADVDGFIDVYDHTSSGTTLISPGANDNQGATNAYFVGSSSDGSIAFFRTDESLTGADTDGYQDIYQRVGATTTLVSAGATGGNAAINVSFGGVSPDGSDVIFETYESLVSSDTDTNYDVYERTNGTTTLLSQGGNSALDARFAGISADAARVFFRTNESLLGSDGDTAEDLYSADAPGKVVVVKDAQPDDPQDFTFTIGGGLSLGLGAPPGQTTFALDDDADPTLSNTQTINNVAPGAGYSVAETVPGGWDQTGSTCNDGSPVSNIDVSPGETVTCTFTNRKRGKIVLVEDSQPNDPQDFAFTAGGGLSPSSFSLDDDADPTLSNTQTFNDLVPGSGYSLAASAQSGWDQTGATCSDGSPIANIDVSAGETVTCTVTNRKRGKVIAVKDSQPNDPQDFNFIGGGGLNPGSFQLDDDADPTLSNTQTYNNVIPASGYSLTETIPSGWDQTGATCDDGSPVSNIGVSAGETVTCTFTNRKRGKIVIVEDSQPNDAQDFSFATAGGLAPSSFSLDDDADGTLSNTQTFNNVVPGSGYAVSETVPSGWDLATSTCDNGSAITNINVSAGETVTCSFTNKKRGSLTVVLDSVPNDPQDFSFTAGGGLSPSSFQLDDHSSPTLPNTQTFSSIAAHNNYSIAETVPSGWDLTSATCDNGSPVSNIDVAPAQAVTCTFVDTKQASIAVVKDAQPNDPQDFSFAAGGGLSPSSFLLDDDSNPTLSNTRTFTNLQPGSGYSVSETVPSGWDQSSATCSDGSPLSNISLSAGENVTCTFVNDKRGSITIVKDAQPNDPQDFSFTAGGGLSPSSFSLDDDSDGTLSNTQTFASVAAGSGYSVAESLPSGWDQSSATCNDGSPISNIDVAPGENVTCTFTNSRRGTIIAVKDAQPNDPQDFSFTAGGGLSPSSFSLDDDADGTLPNSRTFGNVLPGAGYSLAETVPSGWDQSAATCDDGSPVSNIDVAPGETVTCTFTNRKRGTIIAVKDAQPNDPQDFSFTAGGGLSPSSFSLDDDSDPTLSNTRSFNNVVPGSGYSLSETVPTGWDQTGATCSDGSPVSNIVLSAGETVTCTFTNRRRGRIVVVKQAQPNDPQDFSFTAGGGLSPSSFSLDDDSDPTLSNTRSFDDVTPGSGYSLSESVPSGWDQTGATCDDGSPVSNIDVGAGETVTCTFTNRKRGSLTVVKQAQPNDPQDFSFVTGGGLSPSSFSLDDDSDPTLSNTQTYTNVAPGMYSLAEIVPSGWDQTGTSCDDGSPVSSVDVAAGEDVTCTFTNRKRGTIVAVKNAQPNDPQDFSFTAGGGLSPSSFSLDDDSDPTLSNTKTFTAVTPGSGYSLNETVPSGWDQSSAACDDGSPISNIDVSPGETVTCSFTNMKRGSVTVVKDAQPNDPQDFDFTAGGGLSPTSFSLDDDSDPTLSNSRTFSNLAPGSGYSLDETVPSGWQQSSATCDDGSPIGNIDVSAGEHVTCTFTNTQGGSITVVKDAQPNGPQDFDFTAGGGLSPSSFSLDDDSDPTLSNNQTFTDVAAGSGYSLAESVPSGWDQTSATCNDGSPVTNIDMSAGEAITCTFTNRQRGKIVVVKDALPDDPADFSFNASGGLSPSSFQLDDDADPTLSNTQTFNDVTPGGGYSISETSPSPWFQTGADCNDASPVANINVSPGETVTCTFVNSRGFPRPKGATPYRAALAIAFKDCVAPNRSHGAPLITPSCNPPVQSSSFLTVGTNDANGRTPNFVGRLRLDAKQGNPNTPANEADIEISFDTSDIRIKPDLNDYTGELSAGFDFQLTDRFNGTSQTEPGTAFSMPFAFGVPCVATSNVAIGSSCTATTTANAVIPGAVVENKRAIWQLSNVQVFDGGADGVASTTAGNTLFARQGIFVP